MRTWNHRVLCHAEADGTPYFAVHEVHYEYGKPISYSPTNASLGGYDLNQIRWAADRIKAATKKTILWAGKRFPEEYKGEKTT